MQSRCRIMTTGPNNGLQLRDYSKSSNRSENRPLIYKIAIFLSIRAHLAEKMNKLASIYVILAFLSIEFGVFCLILRS